MRLWNATVIRRWLLLTGLVVILTGEVFGQVTEPSGVWLTTDGRSHVSIYPCGLNYCGSVVRLADPYDADGQPQRDEHNPDPAKRNRPLIGMRILRDMAPAAGKARWTGKIYNPEDGDLYDGSIAIRGDRLEVEGCVLIIICQSQLWTKMK